MSAVNPVPREDGDGYVGRSDKRWEKGFFNWLDVFMSSNANRTPINTLQRGTAYAVGDVVRCKDVNAKYFFKCVTAGTTSSVLPSLTNIAGGDVITDGTAEWEVQTITSEEEVDSGFFAKLVTNLAASTAATISSLNTNSLFYRMLSWALTASGVQYNFNNSSAWYICLGSLFGGLIIQGGYYIPSALSGSVPFPVSFSAVSTIVATTTGQLDPIGVTTATDQFMYFEKNIANFRWIAAGR